MTDESFMTIWKLVNFAVEIGDNIFTIHFRVVCPVRDTVETT